MLTMFSRSRNRWWWQQHSRVSMSVVLTAVTATAAQLLGTYGSADCTDNKLTTVTVNTGVNKPTCIKKNDDKPFSSIVVGGGTAGCLTAYLQAKWMLDRGIKGTVLLIERGEDYSSAGPNPKMNGWYDNWGIFGEAHAAVREDGHSPYPVTGTDHRGLGGCSTHDTRITFQPTLEKKQELADAMAWSSSQLDEYFQAALNMIPLERAISSQQPESFYKDVITTLTLATDTNPSPLKRLQGDQFDTQIVVDSVAENTLAMYSDENRWCSALLLKEGSGGSRPSNLTVMTNVTADRVIFNGGEATDDLCAVGVVVRDNNNVEQILRLEDDGQVVVTSGAIGTAAILQRSGVGPPSLLKALGIDMVVSNNEVGHGVDHPEISLLYDWNTALTVPRGGAMGWPLSLFLATKADQDGKNAFVQCHFGAGHADPYTDDDAVVVTPSCIEPDPSAGFRVRILSKDARTSTELVHSEQVRDLNALYNGLIRSAEVCAELQRAGLAGARIVPPPEMDLTNQASKPALLAWIRDNHFTVYHWACTCTAGVSGRVADQYFRLLRNRGEQKAHTGEGKEGNATAPVVRNMFVGSAASLPMLPEANPHLTVSAFSFALAHSMHSDLCASRGVEHKVPQELLQARQVLAGNNAVLKTAQRGCEVPNLHQVASVHARKWREINQVEDQ